MDNHLGLPEIMRRIGAAKSAGGTPLIVEAVVPTVAVADLRQLSSEVFPARASASDYNSIANTVRADLTVRAQSAGGLVVEGVTVDSDEAGAVGFLPPQSSAPFTLTNAVTVSQLGDQRNPGVSAAWTQTVTGSLATSTRRLLRVASAIGGSANADSWTLHPTAPIWVPPGWYFTVQCDATGAGATKFWVTIQWREIAVAQAVESSAP
jgi:hypothetical protein